MVKSNKVATKSVAATPAVEAPVAVQHPILAVPAATPAVPTKAKLRYAPLAVLANPNATITALVSNPHKPGSKSFAKFAMFEVGLTIAQIEAKFVSNNWPRQKARNQLRWDFARGFVTLTAPAS